MDRTAHRRLTAAVVAALVAFSGALYLHVPTDWSALLLSNVAQCIAPALAGGAFWWAARRADNTNHRRAFRLLGLSAVSWGLGQVVWTYYTVVKNVDTPFPSAADLGYLTAVPLAFLGVWSLSDKQARSTRLLALLDGLIVFAGLLAISWPLALGPQYRQHADGAFQFSLSLSYPAGDLIITSAILVVIMRAGKGSRHLPLWHLAGGLVLLAMADSYFVISTIEGIAGNVSFSDVGWVGGYLGLFLAATSYPRRQDAEPHAERGGAASQWRALTPFAVVTIALAVRVWLSLSHHHDDGFLNTVTFVMIAMVLVRQLLTVRENQELTASLREKIGELTSREEQLSHQAFHDPLTGLANRRLFADRVDHALALSQRSLATTAVLFVDLDDFKTVNDSLGHAAGDQLLAAVGTRLSGCVRPGDTVARLGGDEFGILLEEVGSVEVANEAASRMLAALEVPFPINGRQVFTRASIGVAMAEPGPNRTPSSYDTEHLLGDADVALYAAKAAGKSTFRRFERTMRVSAIERLELGQDLRRAIELDQFFCEYQPIVDLVTGKVVALEALVRWDHPYRGLINPTSFIELAEETGLISRIGQRVLGLAVHQVAEWRDAGEVPSGLEIHVNLSGRQLEDPDLAQQVSRVLRSSGLPSSQLVLEITESVAVEGGARHTARLTNLRALGVRLAIDDFGTGYSSLNYLRALPVDVLKIDRAFAETIDGHTDSVLLEAIVRLGHSLGIEMIAEGIEREEQAATLRRLGCRRAQGYLFFRPAPLKDIPRLIASVNAGIQPAPAVWIDRPTDRTIPTTAD